MSPDDAPAVEPGAVHIVDDDEAVRQSLTLLMRSVSLDCHTYARAADFLDQYAADGPACIVSDIRMPGMSGLKLQRTLLDRDIATPILFITGHGDIPMAVSAMRAGAADFLQKPINEDLLLERVQDALAQDRERHARESRNEAIHHCYEQLTRREREVMSYLLRGDANKTIAAALRISIRTVELHRARVLTKMQVANATELLHRAEIAGLPW